ncbi:3-ketoacyl-ACP reductase [Companilactobacillus alimentarius]|uniref:Short-chain dehydrogenase n=1 Tax=Companilactobacillus alimentarius DSM 20249 TaxID=1423720 RepID=A0A2K9HIH4_9LACO|nr:SDR family oxidoreductase [Companilactobacillus alimentarius]AUI72354.1 short-chain dehydrogenase [Companilactobacillus alimentarius DSM 20249]KRK76626.1 short-chain dehydrogenase reductase SDR [Companilactobacillus alimentarius DSM 20249]MDT6952936.1 SDR family oxidoreductase [Companilactobacillus alimentarius]GEO45875.1 3-ketoacyl-ACP reductase [Companilactobacillus alimentarius]
MLKSINGKSAIITGASSGIGKATAIALAHEGVNLVLTARSEDKLSKICKECSQYGITAKYYAGDITQEQTSIEVVKLAMKLFGKIDILIANAGIGLVQDFLDSSMDDYDRLMNTNMRGDYAICLHTLPKMVERHEGQVIITSSVTGINGHGDETAYSASKFANRGFAQSLNKAFRPKGIKICCMDPSATNTQFEINHGRTTAENNNSIMLTSEDIADSMVFVCKQSKNARIMEMRIASMSGD